MRFQPVWTAPGAPSATALPARCHKPWSLRFGIQLEPHRPQLFTEQHRFVGGDSILFGHHWLGSMFTVDFYEEVTTH